jgi:N-acyl homoserine lactone hydrolase
MDPDIATQRGFNPRDFDLGHKLRLVDGEHDVFGDGSVVCLPTHGHTPQASVAQAASRQRRNRPCG